MNTKISSSRWLWYFFTFLLLVQSCSIEPVKLNIPANDTNGALETFCAPDTNTSSEQMFSNRMSGSSSELLRTFRCRSSRGILPRLTDRLLDSVLFFSSSLFFLALLRVFALRIQDIPLRSLQLVRFLHKADGKTSAIPLSYKI